MTNCRYFLITVSGDLDTNGVTKPESVSIPIATNNPHKWFTEHYLTFFDYLCTCDLHIKALISYFEISKTRYNKLLNELSSYRALIIGG